MQALNSLGKWASITCLICILRQGKHALFALGGKKSIICHVYIGGMASLNGKHTCLVYIGRDATCYMPCSHLVEMQALYMPCFQRCMASTTCLASFGGRACMVGNYFFILHALYIQLRATITCHFYIGKVGAGGGPGD